MAKKATKKVPAAKPANWWRVTTEQNYTDICAERFHIEDGVVLFTETNNVTAAWNSWRKVERIDAPVPVEPVAAEPAGEGAEA